MASKKLNCSSIAEWKKIEHATSQDLAKELNGKMKNIGNKWSEYQIKKYGQLSQPLYIIQDVNGNDLSEPRGYDPSVDSYQKFLTTGIAKFKKIK